VKQAVKVPDFKAQDLLTGKAFSLHEREGDVLLIHFWAPWHGLYGKEFRILTQLFQKYKEQHFTVVSIALSEDTDEIKAVIQKYRPSYPVIQAKEDLLKAYQKVYHQAFQLKKETTSLPGFPTLEIDRKGNIVAIHLNSLGVTTLERFEKDLAPLLAEKPPEPKDKTSGASETPSEEKP